MCVTPLYYISFVVLNILVVLASQRNGMVCEQDPTWDTLNDIFPVVIYAWLLLELPFFFLKKKDETHE